jgi:uncharacterized protein (DUF2267 family)
MATRIVFLNGQETTVTETEDQVVQAVRRDHPYPAMANDTDRSITAEQFVTTVAQAARIGLRRAERATEATLQTLAGPDIDVISTDSFIRGVADRAATDANEARRAIEAVLETLAMRIAGGEVDDLRARLPVQFHAALEHVSAVLRAVREAVGEQEFLDVTSQLPAEYEALVWR